MRKQLDWLRQYVPQESLIKGLAYPMLGSPPVITCDNSRYNPSDPNDHDREGLVLSVPLFNFDGELRGCVSAVVLTHILSEILPDGDFALQEATSKTLVPPPVEGLWQRTHGTEPVAAFEPDRTLIYDEVRHVATLQSVAQWKLWAGRPDKVFWSQPGVQAIARTRYFGHIAVFILTFGACLAFNLISRAHARLVELNTGLEHAVEQRTKELRVIAETDRLTGLPNRTVLQRRLEHVLAQCRRSGKYCAILFFDFDRFKVINDSLGHEIGDALLVSIAHRFRKHLRETDTPSRFGGDEFVVLLDALTSPGDACVVAETLLHVFAQPHDLSGQQVVSTASIGVVANEHELKSASDMIRDADSAMYQAKSLGKGRVVAFDQTMHERAMKRLRLEESLRSALDQDQFHLEYQPIVHVDSGSVIAAEALLRWESADHERISPVHFIPVAEDTGLILPIGKWVICAACAQLSEWIARNVFPQEFALSINVSKRQLLDRGFERFLLNCLDEHKLTPAQIKLEVTESTIVDNRAGIVPILQALRKEGFRIMMDDFGTGHSSLSGLHRLPIDELKIDQSFIRESSSNRELIAIIHSIVALAGHLNLKSIGEGVETVEHVALLQTLGCELGQGYFFARPMSPQRFETFLRDTDNTFRQAS